MPKLRVTYDSAGKALLAHVNRGTDADPMWAQLPFDPVTKTFVPKSEAETQLTQEAQSTPEWPLDLSDRPPTPVVLPPDFATFARSVERSNFWKNKIRKTLQDRAFTELVNMMGIVAIAGATPERMQDLFSLWNEVVSSLTVGITIAPADVTFLNTAATDNRVPIVFASNGTASIKS